MINENDLDMTRKIPVCDQWTEHLLFISF